MMDKKCCETYALGFGTAAGIGAIWHGLVSGLAEKKADETKLVKFTLIGSVALVVYFLLYKKVCKNKGCCKTKAIGAGAAAGIGAVWHGLVSGLGKDGVESTKLQKYTYIATGALVTFSLVAGELENLVKF